MSQATLKLERSQLVEELHLASLSLLSDLKQASKVAFGSVGLTYGQALLLIFVEHGVTQPKDLAEALGVAPQALSALVKTMVEQSLLAKTQYPTDARRVEISLSHSGRELCYQIHETWREHNPIDTDAYSENEIRVLITVARRASKRRLSWKTHV